MLDELERFYAGETKKALLKKELRQSWNILTKGEDIPVKIITTVLTTAIGLLVGGPVGAFIGAIVGIPATIGLLTIFHALLKNQETMLVVKEKPQMRTIEMIMR